MNKLSRFLVLALAASSFLFAFNQRGIGSYFSGKDLIISRLQPGEKIDEMVITTGAEGAFPLWSICGPKKVNEYSIMADCGELSHDNLVIGHTLGVMDLVDPSIKWEELNWEMSVDGHPIDLEAFGVYDFVQIFHPSHSGREIVRVSRVWDVVLVNPTPGMHRIDGQVQDKGATYTWVVNFTVPAPLDGQVDPDQHVKIHRNRNGEREDLDLQLARRLQGFIRKQHSSAGWAPCRLPRTRGWGGAS